MAKVKILFVTHCHKQCGVYQFGKNIYGILSSMPSYETAYGEYANNDALFRAVEDVRPDLIFYNYHVGTIGIHGNKIVSLIPELKKAFPHTVHLGFIHEIGEQEVGNILDMFDFGVCADPSFKAVGKRMFKTGRVVPKYENTYCLPEFPIIGSFGFGCAHKGYERLVNMVQDQFGQATIRINMAPQTPFDSNGSIARFRADECRKLVRKPGIRLEITHDFMTQDGLTDFLAKNSINAFLYEDMIRAVSDGGIRGVSSTIDFALAARRPIAVSRSSMFRHVLNASPSIVADETPLSEIMVNGLAPWQEFYKEWTFEKVREEYASILDRALPAIS